jgi:hypothetical protein
MSPLYSPFRAGDRGGPVPRVALRLPWASGYNPVGVGKLLAWVDLGQPNGYHRLLAGIRGEAPGPDTNGASVKPRTTTDPAVAISRLPVPGEHFLGRDAELQALDQAWSDDDTRVFVLVAFGGVGKSALVYKWLEALAADDWRGAERVLGWSFYSQGTDATAASADAFVDFALRWLGNKDEVPGSPWERGLLVARLLRKKRTLLVLDGMEPLQHPPGSQTGRLKDPAIQALVRELAMENDGLCVVTTRLAVADVAGRTGTVERNLERLPSEAGAMLLKNLGVEGSDDEMRTASDEFGGHALALTLLGNYLVEALDGDVRQRGEVEVLDEDIEQGGHAQRVMASYASWLGDGPELQVLRLMGLFDRPAEADAIASLRRAPVVPGLTEGISANDGRPWRKALAHLRTAGLLAANDGGGLDAHPLVRAFFGEVLKEKRPEAWRAGHERLYKHYRGTAKELPDTGKLEVSRYLRQQPQRANPDPRRFDASRGVRREERRVGGS